MTPYEQFWADRRQAEAMHAAMYQPLDVAVYAVRTTRLSEPDNPVPAAIHRRGYLRRRHADVVLPPRMAEIAVMERGS